MKIFSLLALTAAAGLARAHTLVYAVQVNDMYQGLGNMASGYIRSPPNNSPLTDVYSPAMTCNVNNAPTAWAVKVKAGDKITFHWQPFDASHRGPVLTYIALTSSSGYGPVWVKLAQEGWDGYQWGADKLIANGFKNSVWIPNLVSGHYLLRPEIIALHEGNHYRGAQFYMEYVQIEVISHGYLTLPSGVSFPGAYSPTDPGVLFDLYKGHSYYHIPGPPVWPSWASAEGGSAGDSAPPSAMSVAVAATASALFAGGPTTLSTISKASTSSPTAGNGSGEKVQ